MDDAVERVREFIATTQERARSIDQNVGALENFISERGKNSPEAIARASLVSEGEG